jgi:hypothetical protein
MWRVVRNKPLLKNSCTEAVIDAFVNEAHESAALRLLIREQCCTELRR